MQGARGVDRVDAVCDGVADVDGATRSFCDGGDRLEGDTGRGNTFAWRRGTAAGKHQADAAGVDLQDIVMRAAFSNERVAEGIDGERLRTVEIGDVVRLGGAGLRVALNRIGASVGDVPVTRRVLRDRCRLYQRCRVDGDGRGSAICRNLADIRIAAGSLFQHIEVACGVDRDRNTVRHTGRDRAGDALEKQPLRTVAGTLQARTHDAARDRVRHGDAGVALAGTGRRENDRYRAVVGGRAC